MQDQKNEEERYLNREKELRNEIYEKEKHICDSDQMIEDIKMQNLILDMELKHQSKLMEEEVRTRKEFEQNLNNMHTINRNITTKYKRAIQDIY